MGQRLMYFYQYEFFEKFCFSCFGKAKIYTYKGKIGYCSKDCQEKGEKIYEFVSTGLEKCYQDIKEVINYQKGKFVLLSHKNFDFEILKIPMMDINISQRNLERDKKVETEEENSDTTNFISKFQMGYWDLDKEEKDLISMLYHMFKEQMSIKLLEKENFYKFCIQILIALYSKKGNDNRKCSFISNLVGMFYFRSKDWSVGYAEEGIQWCNKSLARKENSKALKHLCLLYMWLGMYVKTFECINRSIKINPNYSAGYYVMGSFFEDFEKYDLSQKCNKIALQLLDDDDDKLFKSYVLAKLGGYYDKQNMFDEALECFKKALELDPFNIDAQEGIKMNIDNRISYNDNPLNYTAHYTYSK